MLVPVLAPLLAVSRPKGLAANTGATADIGGAAAAVLLLCCCAVLAASARGTSSCVPGTNVPDNVTVQPDSNFGVISATLADEVRRL